MSKRAAVAVILPHCAYKARCGTVRPRRDITAGNGTTSAPFGTQGDLMSSTFHKTAMTVALTLAGLTAASAAFAQAQEIKLGFAGPMTGGQAQYGKDMQNGIVLAIDDMNATKPKIGGKEVKFVLVSEDDQADPKTGSVVAQKLVDNGIQGMLGHFNSGTTIPASMVYNRAGIPQIAMATAPGNTPARASRPPSA
jgi:branched-chain amino acid transport system substrate-binding protein